MFADGLSPQRTVRAALAWFAELARDVGGPVLDAGCGPGLTTSHLQDLGVPAFGLDLSPAMVAIARRKQPHMRFEVGSLTDLDLAESSLGGVLAFYSTIRVPDDDMPAVVAGFRRVVRPGGIVMVGFDVDEAHRRKTEGYGGHPMDLEVHPAPSQPGRRLARGDELDHRDTRGDRSRHTEPRRHRHRPATARRPRPAGPRRHARRRARVALARRLPAEHWLEQGRLRARTSRSGRAVER